MAASRFIAVFSRQRGRLLEIAHRLSPRVELYPPHGLILEVPVRFEQEAIHGLAPWITAESRIGGGATRPAALLAASACSGTFVPYGRETEFIEGLPVSSLDFHPDADPKLLQTLDQWGIRTLGELARLPEAALAARLGQPGVRLRRFIRGEDDGRPDPRQPERRFQVSRELEWTIDQIEPLTFVLSGMLEELCAELQTHGLAVETLHLSLQMEREEVFERSLRPALPLQDARTLLNLVRLELQYRPPAAGVRAVFIAADAARPRVFQQSLLQPAGPAPEKLARTVSRLKLLVGEDQVGSPQILDTHRPDSIRLEEFQWRPGRVPPAPERPVPESRLTLRRLRPPQPIELRNEEILACAGPWRSSGDWWLEGGAADGWSRDEWDVELTHGAIFRVYWDHVQRRWFLEGTYD